MKTLLVIAAAFVAYQLITKGNSTGPNSTAYVTNPATKLDYSWLNKGTATSTRH